MADDRKAALPPSPVRGKESGGIDLEPAHRVGSDVAATLDRDDVETAAEQQAAYLLVRRCGRGGNDPGPQLA